MKKIFFACLMSFAVPAFAIPTEPVMVGGSEIEDPCGGFGIVTATTTLFKKNASGIVEFKVVNASQTVLICDSYEDLDGEFVGVVLKQDLDCGLSENMPNKEAYKGPCESGWVKKEHILSIAG